MGWLQYSFDTASLTGISSVCFSYPVSPEPDNHPASFAATADSSSQITTSWTDSIGTNLPAGYLVMCNETGTFSDPIDGTAQSDDSDCSDGSGVMNVAHGTGGNYVWTGLNSSTQYFYTIFPYSNAGADIDYKTDGTPGTANATTNVSCTTPIVVTDAASSGVGTLRQAIADICEDGLITFGGDHTIDISADGELAIDKSMTIDGEANAITVSGGDVTRVFNVMTATAAIDVNVTFDSLTIADGNVQTYDCVGSTARCGGGIMIRNSGVAITITHSILINNTADNIGGGIDNNDGAVTISNSTFSGNSAGHGGGIINENGTVTVSNSTFSGNTATFFGGGINSDSGPVMVTNSTFSGNTANIIGGGIYNTSGPMTISNSTFSGNTANSASGGGVYNTSGPMTVSNSTFSGNTAGDEGGGIYNRDTMTVTNSTFSGNSAVYGGGIYHYNVAATISNSTFSGNSATYGGGINNTFGTLHLSNTILANTPSGDDCSSSHGLATDVNNLIEVNDDCGTPVSTADPLLGALADNGGDTFTYALLPGSPAIDAGDCASGPAADQRGITRPQDSTCDIGAFESRGYTFAYTSGSPQTTGVNTPFTNPLVLAVSSAVGEPVDGGQVTFTAPASGAGLTFTEAAATISGGAVSQSVTANGTAGSYTVTANASGNLGSGIDYALTNVIIDPEPDNHPASFAAAADSSSQITTSWTDSIGTNLPAGYLVMCNETGTFSDPVDGTAQSDDSDCSDGSGVMNVAYGTGGNYVWTGLNSSTQYFYTIFPYSNAGVIIDYKTDGTPGTADATTTSAACTIYASTDVPKTIPASGTPTVLSVINVPDSGIISDINVLNLAGTHTWIGDLDFQLESPTATSIQLRARACVSADNFDINYDDAGSSSSPPCPPTDGLTYQPDGPGTLADFNGEHSSGTWTLIINDNVNSDGGQLNSWSLEICSTPLTLIQLDLSDSHTAPVGHWNTIADGDMNNLVSGLIDFNSGSPTAVSYTGNGWISSYSGEDNWQGGGIDWVLDDAADDQFYTTGAATITFGELNDSSRYIIELVVSTDDTSTQSCMI